MKVFISADMEGITGVVQFNQVLSEKKEYKEAQTLMAGDVNAAIQGALDAGAKEIIVNDSHGTMTNIVLSQLNPAARLISGFDKPLCMMQGVEGYDAALFVGYHAKIGTQNAILDHTYFSSLVNCVRLNGVEVGEPEINTVLAGYFSVPVVFLSGDEVVCHEAKSFIGEQLETATVKKAVGRSAAECLHPDKSHELIKKGVKKALDNLSIAKPFHIDVPTSIFEVEFFLTQMADQASIYPFAERMNGRTIKVKGKTILEGFQAFMTILELARTQ